MKISKLKQTKKSYLFDVLKKKKKKSYILKLFVMFGNIKKYKINYENKILRNEGQLVF